MFLRVEIACYHLTLPPIPICITKSNGLWITWLVLVDNEVWHMDNLLRDMDNLVGKFG